MAASAGAFVDINLVGTTGVVTEDLPAKRTTESDALGIAIVTCCQMPFCATEGHYYFYDYIKRNNLNPSYTTCKCGEKKGGRTKNET
ncbi:hypothetical protein ACFL4C_04700 [Candidatus Omnitrophota bacterium]